VQLEPQPRERAHLREFVVAPVPAQLADDLHVRGVVLNRLLVPEVGHQVAYRVAALPEAGGGAVPDRLVAPEVVRREEAADAEDAQRGARRHSLRSYT